MGQRRQLEWRRLAAHPIRRSYLGRDAQRDPQLQGPLAGLHGQTVRRLLVHRQWGPLRTRSGELPAGWRTYCGGAQDLGPGPASRRTSGLLCAKKWGRSATPGGRAGHLPLPHPKSVQLRVRAPRHHLRGAHPSRRRRARIPRYRARLTARRPLYVHYLLLCQRARRQALARMPERLRHVLLREARRAEAAVLARPVR